MAVKPHTKFGVWRGTRAGINCAVYGRRIIIPMVTGQFTFFDEPIENLDKIK